MDLDVTPTAMFRWRRHQNVTIEDFLLPSPIKDERELIDRLHVVASGSAETYEPFRQAPDAWRSFAGITMERIAEGTDLSDGEIEQRVVRFVREYGLPRPTMLVEPDYQQLIEVVRESWALALGIRAYSAIKTDSLNELREWIRHYRAVGEIRGFANDNDFRRTLWRWLAASLREHIQGVKLLPHYSDQEGKVVPYWTCDSLLTAMWQQFYNFLVEGAVIRLRCKGCSRPYIPKDPRAQYCEPSCRNAANQRTWQAKHARKRGDI